MATVVWLATAAKAASQVPPDTGGVADTLDWLQQFNRGKAFLESDPRRAREAFLQASRLDPSRAEPLIGRWAAEIVKLSKRDFARYLSGNAAVLKRPEIRIADSLRTLAVVRNPFTDRSLEGTVFLEFGVGLPRTDEEWAWLAEIRGDPAEAIIWYSRIIASGRRETFWYRIDRAIVHVAMDDVVAARADLDTLLTELRHRDERAKELVVYQAKHRLLYLLGRVCLSMEDYEGARRAFGDALLENAGFAYGYVGLGSVSRALRESERSADEFRSALELAPEDALIQFLLAQALFDAGRHDDAGPIVEKVMALESAWALPHLLMGHVRLRQGRADLAERHFAQFVDMSSAADEQAAIIRARLRRPPSP